MSNRICKTTVSFIDVLCLVQIRVPTEYPYKKKGLMINTVFQPRMSPVKFSHELGGNGSCVVETASVDVRRC